MTAIWNFIKKYYKQIIFVILGLFVVFLLIQNNHLKSESSNVVVIYKDSLATYKNKVDELYAAQLTYVVKIKDLEKINEDLYKEAKNLRDNPLIITKIETEYKIDTIRIESTDVKKDSVYICYNWNYKDDWYSTNGISKFNCNTNIGKTDIYNTNFISCLTVDVIENKDNQLEIIVKDDNPYCTIKEINGAVISPDKIKSISSNVKNKNRWGLGIQLGVGAGYCDKKIICTPYLGVGISYNLITF